MVTPVGKERNSVLEYTRRLGKSIVYGTFDAIKEQMPMTAALIENNKETAKQLYKDVLGSRQQLTKLKTMQDTYLFKPAEQLLKNLKADLKSGVFYHPERAAQQEEEGMKSMMESVLKDAGMEDLMDLLTGDGDMTESEMQDLPVQPVAQVSSGDALIATSIAKEQRGATQSLVKTQTSLVEAQLRTTRTIANMQFKQMQRHTSIVTQGLSNMTEGLNAIISFNNDVVLQHAKNAMQYFETMTGLAQENNAILKEMVEMKRNTYKKQSQDEALEGTPDPFKNGQFDLKAYVDVLKSNVENSMFGQMGMMIAAVPAMIAGIVANPIHYGTKAIATAFLGPALRMAMKGFDRSINGYLQMGLTKMAEWGKRPGTGILGELAKLFGVETKKVDVRSINISKNIKEPRSWDGEDHYYLTKVIPSYLANIESALTGAEARIFDMQQGKWNTRSGIMRKARQQEQQLAESNLGEIRQAFYKDLMSTMNLGKNPSKKVLRQIQRGIDDLMLGVQKNGGLGMGVDEDTKNFKDILANKNGEYGDNEQLRRIFYEWAKSASYDSTKRQMFAAANGRVISSKRAEAERRLQGGDALTDVESMIATNSDLNPVQLQQYSRLVEAIEKAESYFDKDKVRELQQQLANLGAQSTAVSSRAGAPSLTSPLLGTENLGISLIGWQEKIYNVLVDIREGRRLGRSGGKSSSSSSSSTTTDQSSSSSNVGNPLDEAKDNRRQAQSLNIEAKKWIEIIKKEKAKPNPDKKLIKDAEAEIARCKKEARRLYSNADLLVARTRGDGTTIWDEDYAALYYQDLGEKTGTRTSRSKGAAENVLNDKASMEQYLTEMKNQLGKLRDQDKAIRAQFEHSFMDDIVGSDLSDKEIDDRLRSYGADPKASFLKQLAAAGSIGNKIGVISANISKITNAPRAVLTSVIMTADKVMYDFMFGKSTDESDPTAPKGLFGKMSSMMSESAQNLSDKISNIADDLSKNKGKWMAQGKAFLKDWFGIDLSKAKEQVEDFTKPFKEGFQAAGKGLFGDITGAFRGTLADMGIVHREGPPIPGRAYGQYPAIVSKDEAIIRPDGSGTTRVKKSGVTAISDQDLILNARQNPWNPNRMSANLDADEKNENRIRSTVLSKMRSAGGKDYAAALPGFAEGKSVNSLEYLLKKLDPEDYEMVIGPLMVMMNAYGIGPDQLKDKAADFVGKGAAKVSAELGITDEEKKFLDQEILQRLWRTKTIRSNPMLQEFLAKMLKGAGYKGKLATEDEMVYEDYNRGQGIANGMGQFVMQAIGTDPSKAMAETKKYVIHNTPELMKGGMAGALIGSIFPLGGPLFGALAGSAVQVLANNKSFMNYVFGTEVVDQAGNKSRKNDGIVSMKFMKSLEKYLPDMKKYGITGSLLGLVTPFGPIGGLMAGMAASYIKNNENTRNFLFGDSGGLLNKDRKAAIKKALPNIGAAMLSTFFLGPFGLLGNAVLGAGLGMLSTTEMFKKIMLGAKDRKGVRHGGLAGAIQRHITNPIKANIKTWKKEFATWFRDDVTKPIGRGLKPIGDEIKIQLKRGMKGAMDTFLDAFVKASPMAEKFFDKLLGKGFLGGLIPGIRQAGGIGKYLLQKTIGAGARKLAGGIEKVGRRLRKGQLEKFQLNDLSTTDTLAEMRDLNIADTSAGIGVKSIHDMGEEELAAATQNVQALSDFYSRDTKRAVEKRQAKQMNYMMSTISDVTKNADYTSKYMKIHSDLMDIADKIQNLEDESGIKPLLKKADEAMEKAGMSSYDKQRIRDELTTAHIELGMVRKLREFQNEIGGAQSTDESIERIRQDIFKGTISREDLMKLIKSGRLAEYMEAQRGFKKKELEADTAKAEAHGDIVDKAAHTKQFTAAEAEKVASLNANTEAIRRLTEIINGAPLRWDEKYLPDADTESLLNEQRKAKVWADHALRMSNKKDQAELEGLRNKALALNADKTIEGLDTEEGLAAFKEAIRGDNKGSRQITRSLIELGKAYDQGNRTVIKNLEAILQIDKSGKLMSRVTSLTICGMEVDPKQYDTINDLNDEEFSCALQLVQLSVKIDNFEMFRGLKDNNPLLPEMLVRMAATEVEKDGKSSKIADMLVADEMKHLLTERTDAISKQYAATGSMSFLQRYFSPEDNGQHAAWFESNQMETARNSINKTGLSGSQLRDIQKSIVKADISDITGKHTGFVGGLQSIGNFAKEGITSALDRQKSIAIGLTDTVFDKIKPGQSLVEAFRTVEASYQDPQFAKERANAFVQHLVYEMIDFISKGVKDQIYERSKQISEYFASDPYHHGIVIKEIIEAVRHKRISGQDAVKLLDDAIAGKQINIPPPVMDEGSGATDSGTTSTTYNPPADSSTQATAAGAPGRAAGQVPAPTSGGGLGGFLGGLFGGNNEKKEETTEEPEKATLADTKLKSADIKDAMSAVSESMKNPQTIGGSMQAPLERGQKTVVPTPYGPVSYTTSSSDGSMMAEHTKDNTEVFNKEAEDIQRKERSTSALETIAEKLGALTQPVKQQAKKNGKGLFDMLKDFASLPFNMLGGFWNAFKSIPIIGPLAAALLAPILGKFKGLATAFGAKVTDLKSKGAGKVGMAKGLIRSAIKGVLGSKWGKIAVLLASFLGVNLLSDSTAEAGTKSGDKDSSDRDTKGNPKVGTRDDPRKDTGLIGWVKDKASWALDLIKENPIVSGTIGTVAGYLGLSAIHGKMNHNDRVRAQQERAANAQRAADQVREQAKNLTSQEQKKLIALKQNFDNARTPEGKIKAFEKMKSMIGEAEASKLTGANAETLKEAARQTARSAASRSVGSGFLNSLQRGLPSFGSVGKLAAGLLAAGGAAYAGKKYLWDESNQAKYEVENDDRNLAYSIPGLYEEFGPLSPEELKNVVAMKKAKQDDEIIKGYLRNIRKHMGGRLEHRTANDDKIDAVGDVSSKAGKAALAFPFGLVETGAANALASMVAKAPEAGARSGILGNFGLKHSLIAGSIRTGIDVAMGRQDPSQMFEWKDGDMLPSGVIPDLVKNTAMSMGANFAFNKLLQKTNTSGTFELAKLDNEIAQLKKAPGFEAKVTEKMAQGMSRQDAMRELARESLIRQGIKAPKGYGIGKMLQRGANWLGNLGTKGKILAGLLTTAGLATVGNASFAASHGDAEVAGLGKKPIPDGYKLTKNDQGGYSLIDENGRVVQVMNREQAVKLARREKDYEDRLAALENRTAVERVQDTAYKMRDKIDESDKEDKPDEEEGILGQGAKQVGAIIGTGIGAQAGRALGHTKFGAIAGALGGTIGSNYLMDGELPSMGDAVSRAAITAGGLGAGWLAFKHLFTPPTVPSSAAGTPPAPGTPPPSNPTASSTSGKPPTTPTPQSTQTHATSGQPHASTSPTQSSSGQPKPQTPPPQATPTPSPTGNPIDQAKANRRQAQALDREAKQWRDIIREEKAKPNPDMKVIRDAQAEVTRCNNEASQLRSKADKLVQQPRTSPSNVNDKIKANANALKQETQRLTQQTQNGLRAADAARNAVNGVSSTAGAAENAAKSGIWNKVKGFGSALGSRLLPIATVAMGANALYNLVSPSHSEGATLNGEDDYGTEYGDEGALPPEDDRGIIDKAKGLGLSALGVVGGGALGAKLLKKHPIIGSLLGSVAGQQAAEQLGATEGDTSTVWNMKMAYDAGKMLNDKFGLAEKFGLKSGAKTLADGAKEVAEQATKNAVNTGTNAAETAAAKASKLATQATKSALQVAEDVGEKGKTIMTKVVEVIDKVKAGILKYMPSGAKGFVDRASQAIIKKIAEPRNIATIAAKVAKSTVSSIPIIGWVIGAGFVAAGAISGYRNAEEILEIPEGTATPAMKGFAAFIGAITGAPILMFIPASVYVSLLLPLAKFLGFDTSDLEALRKEKQKQEQDLKAAGDTMNQDRISANAAKTANTYSTASYQSSAIQATKTAAGNIGSKGNAVSDATKKDEEKKEKEDKEKKDKKKEEQETKPTEEKKEDRPTDKKTASTKWEPPKTSDGKTLREAFNEKIEAFKRWWNNEDYNNTGKGTSRYGRGSYGKGEESFDPFHVKQTNPLWADWNFNKNGDTELQTVGDSLCGPSTYQMARNRLLGQTTSAEDMQNMVKDSLPYKGINDGVSEQFMVDEASKDGMKARKVTSRSEMARAMNEGKYVSIMGNWNNTGMHWKGAFDPHKLGLGRGTVMQDDPESDGAEPVDSNELLAGAKSAVILEPDDSGRGRRRGRGHYGRSDYKAEFDQYGLNQVAEFNKPDFKNDSGTPLKKSGVGHYGRSSFIDIMNASQKGVSNEVGGKILRAFFTGIGDGSVPSNNSDDKNSSPSGSSATVSDNMDEGQIWDWFRAKGYKPEATAGIMGRLKQETGNYSPKYEKFERWNGDGEVGGFGMFQWTYGDGQGYNYPDPMGKDKDTVYEKFPDSRLVKYMKWVDENKRGEYESSANELEYLWQKDMDDHQTYATLSRQLSGYPRSSKSIKSWKPADFNSLNMSDALLKWGMDYEIGIWENEAESMAKEIYDKYKDRSASSSGDDKKNDKEKKDDTKKEDKGKGTYGRGTKRLGRTPKLGHGMVGSPYHNADMPDSEDPSIKKRIAGLGRTISGKIGRAKQKLMDKFASRFGKGIAIPALYGRGGDYKAAATSMSQFAKSEFNKDVPEWFWRTILRSESTGSEGPMTSEVAKWAHNYGGMDYDPYMKDYGGKKADQAITGGHYIGVFPNEESGLKAEVAWFCRPGADSWWTSEIDAAVSGDWEKAIKMHVAHYVQGVEEVDDSTFKSSVYYSVGKEEYDGKKGSSGGFPTSSDSKKSDDKSGNSGGTVSSGGGFWGDLFAAIKNGLDNTAGGRIMKAFFTGIGDSSPGDSRDSSNKGKPVSDDTTQVSGGGDGLSNIKETNLDFSGGLSPRPATNRIVIHHTGDQDMDADAKTIHSWHKANGWSGIGYHFVIRKDGTIERGRPIDAIGSHAQGSNSDTLGIHVCGGFNSAQPTDKQLASLAQLIADLSKKYNIVLDRQYIIGHYEVCDTSCPGTNLTNKIESVISKAKSLVGNAPSNDTNKGKEDKKGKGTKGRSKPKALSRPKSKPKKPYVYMSPDAEGAGPDRGSKEGRRTLGLRTSYDGMKSYKKFGRELGRALFDAHQERLKGMGTLLDVKRGPITAALLRPKEFAHSLSQPFVKEQPTTTKGRGIATIANAARDSYVGHFGRAVSSPSDNAAMWEYLKKKGLSNVSTAGVMGNFQAESSMYSDMVEGGTHSNECPRNPSIQDDADVPGYGLPQFTWSTYKDGLIDYANSKGKPHSDWKTQIDFLFGDSRSGFSPNILKKMDETKDPYKAALVWHSDYEKSNDTESMAARRGEYAKKFFETEGKGQIDGDSSLAVETSKDGEKSSSGGDGGFWGQLFGAFNRALRTTPAGKLILSFFGDDFSFGGDGNGGGGSSDKDSGDSKSDGSRNAEIVDAPVSGSAAAAMISMMGNAPITSHYGPRGSGFHSGVDIGVGDGTKVPSPIDAEVDDCGSEGGGSSGYGHYVVLKDSKGYFHIFGHLSDNSKVSKGQKIKAGTIIALSGHSGHCIPDGPDGAHVHYGIYPSSNPGCAGRSDINPETYSIEGLATKPSGKGTKGRGYKIIKIKPTRFTRGSDSGTMENIEGRGTSLFGRGTDAIWKEDLSEVRNMDMPNIPFQLKSTGDRNFNITPEETKMVELGTHRRFGRHNWKDQFGQYNPTNVDEYNKPVFDNDSDTVLRSKLGNLKRLGVPKKQAFRTSRFGRGFAFQPPTFRKVDQTPVNDSRYIPTVLAKADNEVDNIPKEQLSSAARSIDWTQVSEHNRIYPDDSIMTQRAKIKAAMKQRDSLYGRATTNYRDEFGQYNLNQVDEYNKPDFENDSGTVLRAKLDNLKRIGTLKKQAFGAGHRYGRFAPVIAIAGMTLRTWVANQLRTRLVQFIARRWGATRAAQVNVWIQTNYPRIASALETLSTVSDALDVCNIVCKMIAGELNFPELMDEVSNIAQDFVGGKVLHALGSGTNSKGEESETLTDEEIDNLSPQEVVEELRKYDLTDVPEYNHPKFGTDDTNVLRSKLKLIVKQGKLKDEYKKKKEEPKPPTAVASSTSLVAPEEPKKKKRKNFLEKGWDALTGIWKKAQRAVGQALGFEEPTTPEDGTAPAGQTPAKRKYTDIQAPNGLYIEKNDVDYLVSQGMTEQQAIDILLKDKKYTEKVDTAKLAQVRKEKMIEDQVFKNQSSQSGLTGKKAPNGLYYEKNDVDYLMKQPWVTTEEQAYSILSKEKKYTEKVDKKAIVAQQQKFAPKKTVQPKHPQRSTLASPKVTGPTIKAQRQSPYQDTTSTKIPSWALQHTWTVPPNQAPVYKVDVRGPALQAGKKMTNKKAPNGLYYEQNDVDYLMKQPGMTEEKAYEILSKEDKYTKEASPEEIAAQDQRVKAQKYEIIPQTSSWQRARIRFNPQAKDGRQRHLGNKPPTGSSISSWQMSVPKKVEPPKPRVTWGPPKGANPMVIAAKQGLEPIGDVNKDSKQLSDYKAPNGLYIEQNDIDYLVNSNKGMTEEQAYEILSKEEKYTKEVDPKVVQAQEDSKRQAWLKKQQDAKTNIKNGIAPNGLPFDKNDVDYLMAQPWVTSKEQAYEILSKEEKYNKPVDKKTIDVIKKQAQKQAEKKEQKKKPRGFFGKLIDWGKRVFTTIGEALGITPKKPKEEESIEVPKTQNESDKLAKQLSDYKAPNGLYIEQNDIDYLVNSNKGMTEEQAVAILSKEEKYTKEVDPKVVQAQEDSKRQAWLKQNGQPASPTQTFNQRIGQSVVKGKARAQRINAITKNGTRYDAVVDDETKTTNDGKVNEIAPNGKPYEENDIQYLMKNGYSREDAITLLSKHEKYTKKTAENPIQAQKKVQDQRVKAIEIQKKTEAQIAGKTSTSYSENKMDILISEQKQTNHLLSAILKAITGNAKEAEKASEAPKPAPNIQRPDPYAVAIGTKDILDRMAFTRSGGPGYMTQIGNNPFGIIGVLDTFSAKT